MGMTMAEKILARASGRKVVTPGEYLTAPIDLLLINDRGFPETYEAMLQSGLTKVWDPDRIVVVIDHSVPAPSVKGAEEHQKIRSYVQSLKIKNFYDVAEGIEHQLLIEKGHIRSRSPDGRRGFAYHNARGSRRCLFRNWSNRGRLRHGQGVTVVPCPADDKICAEGNLTQGGFCEGYRA